MYNFTLFWFYEKNLETRVQMQKSFVWVVKDVLVKDRGSEKGKEGQLEANPPREIQSQRKTYA